MVQRLIAGSTRPCSHRLQFPEIDHLFRFGGAFWCRLSSRSGHHDGNGHGHSERTGAVVILREKVLWEFDILHRSDVVGILREHVQWLFAYVRCSGHSKRTGAVVIGHLHR